MHYQDRDRLTLSTLLAVLIFSVLFIVLGSVNWGDFDPFPELSQPIIVDLESFPSFEESSAAPRGDAPAEPISPPVTETVEPDPVPRETSPPATSPSAAAPAVSPASAAPSTPAVTAGPAPRPDSSAPPAPAPASPPSAPAPRASASSAAPSSAAVPAGRSSPEASAVIPAPRPRSQPQAPDGIDPALAADIKFKEEQLAALEKWFAENARGIAPSEGSSYAPAPAQAEGADRAPTVDSETAKMMTEKYKALTRDLLELKRQTGETVSAPGPSGPTERSLPGKDSAAAPVIIKDTEGMDLGRGFLGGRSPRGGLALKIGPEDFDGDPPREIKIAVEFSILDSGIVDPSSLIFSGDQLYTNVTRKIRDALKDWGFTFSPGVITKAKISFVIRTEKK